MPASSLNNCAPWSIWFWSAIILDDSVVTWTKDGQVISADNFKVLQVSKNFLPIEEIIMYRPTNQTINDKLTNGQLTHSLNTVLSDLKT